MDPQHWATYQDPAATARQSRYPPHGMPPQQGVHGDHGSAPPIKQDPYGPMTIAGRSAPSLAPTAAPPLGGIKVEYGDTDGDIKMEDIPEYKPKSNLSAVSRSAHQRMPSNVKDEESAAARRYSPMNLSPTMNYATASQPSSQVPYSNYTPQGSARTSPTRSSYIASTNYYNSPPTSRPSAPQLPPIQSNMGSSYHPASAPLTLPLYARDLSLASPRQSQQVQPAPVIKGPPPKFAKCTTIAELQPKINDQPPFRRAKPEGGFLSPLQALTTQLPATYRICNPSFKYESSRNPRRVLTKPSKGVKNDGYDNEESDYILYVNDILGSEDSGHKNRYLILDVLGQGTFGQVVKCQNLRTQEVVAVKVVKNRTAYFNQSMMEVSVLDLLNKSMDKNDDHHLLRLKDTFIHRQHLCLVFELLSVNLYELIKQNQFRGLSTTLVRVFAQQLLTGLALLSKAKLIHCDLKPENILLKNLESPIIKIIDFGSACDERQTVYTYIQSRFYRSPEVLLGLPYSAAIDMWSLGCIVVELFLGLPLFPGSSEYNQVARITEMLGLPPVWMLDMGKQSMSFYEKVTDEFGRRTYRLKSMDQYSRENKTKEQPSKKYFTATTLPDIIKKYPMPRKNMKPHEMDREMANRTAFIDFAQGLLNLNPLERWTPNQAKAHPFITQSKFTGPFVPPMTLHSTSSKSPAPGVQEQQRAEAMSKQRQQQQQQAQAQAQQQAAYVNMQMQYATPPLPSQQPYAMYSPGVAAPPPYNAVPPYAGQVPLGGNAGMPMAGGSSGALPRYQPTAQQPVPQVQQPAQTVSMYGQAPMSAGQQQQQAAARGARQRASTLEQHQSGIPASLQRVMGHLDPNAPIRLQPSPAYYPPPLDGEGSGSAGAAGSRRRSSRSGQGAGRGNGNRDFIRTLEDRTLEEGFMNNNHWQ